MSTREHEQLVADLIGRWPESHPQPSLERIQALCTLLGDPQNACPVIAVTGTNGKGSTSLMIEALARSLGLRTGLFTSPHLVDVRERIRIDGEPISVERFDEIYDEIAPMIEMVDAQRLGGVPLTFFEIITTMAYAAFADAPVDVAIMEVGMGGRWDATSVADAQVGVIGPIDLDHTHLLGETIAEIAREKAGIIKPGTIAVIADQTPEAARVLAEHCSQVGSRMIVEGRDYALEQRTLAVGGQMIRLRAAEPVGEVFLPLVGEHMARNAATAVAAVEALQGGRALPREVIADGLAEVIAPARLELVDDDPSILIDTAHNPHGVRATVAALRDSFLPEPLIAVVAMMRDKAVDQVLEILADEVDEMIVTTIRDNERALGVEDLAERATTMLGARRVSQAPDAIRAIEAAKQRAQESGPGAVVLVIGSVYLAGEVRHYILPDDAARPRREVSVAVADEDEASAADLLLAYGSDRAELPSDVEIYDALDADESDESDGLDDLRDLEDYEEFDEGL